ncbi:hypothetical protein [Streptomyces inhibens]|uniref:hypothetical protein n=1 Tax=Streptomyces inhibens TaxID=2293571 RepID=UPI001EE74169|nr:hypothetical protein [Streptomyces inhibens]UKY54826.1 hypothetical protein KI385_42660 [Streptomyces inhibens]
MWCPVGIDITEEARSDAQAADPSSGTASTHALGPGECPVLDEALDRLPRTLVVHAVEAADTALGTGLSEPVRAALPELADRVLASVRQAHDATGRPR